MRSASFIFRTTFCVAARPDEVKLRGGNRKRLLGSAYIINGRWDGRR
jgi:hypothetical protein